MTRYLMLFFFFQAEDGIRDYKVTGVQTCALPILLLGGELTISGNPGKGTSVRLRIPQIHPIPSERSEEHTSELQSPCNLVCRLLLEKKKQHSIGALRRTIRVTYGRFGTSLCPVVL